MHDRDPESVKAALANLRELAEEIRGDDSPADAFAAAAQEHSESVTAQEGGRVGWVEKDGDLPTAVMKIVRKTPANQLGDPVLSPLGMHLVYVHQVVAGDRTFDQLEDQAQLRRDAADTLFQGLVSAQSDAKVVWYVKALRPPERPSELPSERPSERPSEPSVNTQP